MNKLNLEGVDFYFTRGEVKAGLLFSLLIVWVMVGLFAYLNRYTRRRYFTYWTAAWMFYALWITLHFGVRGVNSSASIWTVELWCVGVSAVFLLWGGLLFLGKRVPQRMVAWFLLFLLVWSYVGAYHVRDRLPVEAPVFALVGLSSLFSAWSFLTYRRRRDYIGATLLTGGFGLWGAFMAAEPFLGFQEDLGGLTLFISAALQLFVAVSMIVLVLEEARHTQQVVMKQMRARREETVLLKSRVLSTEERYRMLFEQASEAIVIVAAADLKILELNPAAEHLLGLTRAEAARHSIDEFFHDRDRADTTHFTSPNWIQSLQQQPRWQIRRKSGEVVPIEVEASPVDLNGLFGYQLFLREVTERMRLEQQLRQSEKLSALGQMISGVAHELNSPLAVIKGYLDLMLMRHELSPQTRQDLEKVAQESNRAAKLVQNFLAFAREQPAQRVAVQLNELLQRVIELRKMDLLSNAVELQLELAPDLPVVYADPDAIQQVFVNIINNAIQAMQAAAGARRLRIVSNVHKQKAHVVIEDSGPGVPAHLESRIFEPLFTTKDVGTGTGLGLSIAHAIVSEHKGRIYYQPATIGGAAFVIELPFGEPASPPAPAEVKLAEPPSPRPAPPAPAIADGDILVLDDEGVICEMIGEMLSLLGYRPTLTQNAAQALELISQHDFKAIVSDFRMPGMNGRQFYEAMIKRKPELGRRIIFLTGDTVNAETLAFLESTGNPHLPKPFQLGQIEEAIAEVVRRARSEPVVPH